MNLKDICSVRHDNRKIFSSKGSRTKYFDRFFVVHKTVIFKFVLIMNVLTLDQKTRFAFYVTTYALFIKYKNSEHVKKRKKKVFD